MAEDGAPCNWQKEWTVPTYDVINLVEISKYISVARPIP